MFAPQSRTDLTTRRPSRFWGRRSSAAATALLALSVGLATVGCHRTNRDPPPEAGPALLRVVQDRNLDPEGRVIVFTFDEPLMQSSAANLVHYVASDGQPCLLAFHSPGGSEARVVFGDLCIPGHTTFDVAGLMSEDGNEMAAVSGIPLTSTDSTPPAATRGVATAVENPLNDSLLVEFDDRMVPADVLDKTRFAFEHPVGTPVSLADASFTYTESTNSLVIRFSSPPSPTNLQFGIDWRLTFGSLRDLGGNGTGEIAVGGTVVGDQDKPAVVQVTHNTVVDPMGQTVDVTFDEVVSPATASTLSHFGGSAGQQAISMTLMWPGDRVQVKFDSSLIPGIDLLNIAGVGDLAGNIMDPIQSAVAGVDDTPPELRAVALRTETGAFNDILTVAFDEPVLPAGATDLANFALQSPSGTPRVLDPGNYIVYDPFTRTTTIVLASQATPTNLQTGESFDLLVSGVTDVAGNPIDNGAWAGRVGGDTVPPALVQVTQNTTVDPLGSTVDLAFTEVVSATSASALATYSGSGGQRALATTLLWPGDVVQVTFDAPMIPGTHTLDVAGVEDLAGIEMSAVLTQTVAPVDTTPPHLANVVVRTITGQYNDYIRIWYSEPVLPGGATDPASFLLRSPSGVVVPIFMTSWIGYDQAARHTTIILKSKLWPLNLQTGDTFDLTVTGVRDVAGNLIDPNGVWPTGTVGGDTLPPAMLGSTATAYSGPGNDMLRVFFTEELVQRAAEDPVHYVFESPPGQPVPLTGATFNYQPVGSLSLVEIFLPVGVNLQSGPPPGEDYSLSVTGLIDHAGNVMRPATQNKRVGGDVTPPNLLAIMQKTTVDPSGATLDLAFEEVMDESSAKQLSSAYAASGGQAAISADLIGAGDVVRVVFDAPVVPSAHTLDVSSLRDLAGNTMPMLLAGTILAEDTTRPRLANVTVRTKWGPFNDVVTVVFNEPMLPTGAASLSHFGLQSPTGSFLGISSGTRIHYDPVTWTTTIVLASQTMPIDLQTGDSFTLAAHSLTDVAGNVIQGRLWSGTVTGDTTPPSLQYATQRTSVDPYGMTVELAFNEALDRQSAETLANYSASGGQNPVSASVVPAGVPMFSLIGASVRVTFDAPVPQGTTVSAQGVRDLAGNAMAPGSQVVVPEDTDPPTVDSVVATAIANRQNDTIEVVFNEPVMAPEAAFLGAYQLESPIGTPIALDPFTAVTYDPSLLKATLVLSSALQPVNLQTGQQFKLSVQGIRDVAGNMLAPGTAVTGTVVGDSVPPIKTQGKILSLLIFDRVLDITFSEELDPSSVLASSWTFSQGLQMVVPTSGAVSLRADGRTVRLVTLLPNFPGQTVDCTGLNDLAGNVIDPADPAVVITP